MPLGAQGRRKAERRAADMSAPPPASGAATSWRRAYDDDCEEYEYFFVPDGADPAVERVVVRMVSHPLTDDLVEFAVVHQTHHRGRWENVASADSCHDDDVHVHRYAKSTGQRVGEPQSLMSVESQADIDRGYELAYDHIADDWRANRERWSYV